MTHPDPQALSAPPSPAPSALHSAPPAQPVPAASPPPEPSQASFLQAAGAVFWSFFGVRKRRHMQQDMTIKPLHVVIFGLLGGLVFVLTLVALVTFITRNTS